MIVSQDYLTFWAIAWVPHVISKELFRRQFIWNDSNTKLGIIKMFIVFWKRFACIYKLFVDPRQAVFHQLFNWTLAEPSKYPFNKIIGLENHLIVWAVPKVLCVIGKVLNFAIIIILFLTWLNGIFLLALHEHLFLITT